MLATYLFSSLKIVEKYSNSNIEIHTFNQVCGLFLLYFNYTYISIIWHFGVASNIS
jgi:hypothetical protein